MKLHAILALNLIILWTTAGTKVQDSLTLRVFNKDLSMSDTEMHKILKTANLESHGYLKEVTTTKTRRPGSSTPDYVKTYYYYKVVPCDRVMEIEKELNKLLNGLLGSSVARKAYKDLSKRKIYSGKQCKAGVEIHFRGQQSCGQKKGRRVKRGCGWCFICFSVESKKTEAKP